jgi:hypothetical protein
MAIKGLNQDIEYEVYEIGEIDQRMTAIASHVNTLSGNLSGNEAILRAEISGEFVVTNDKIDDISGLQDDRDDAQDIRMTQLNTDIQTNAAAISVLEDRADAHDVYLDTLSGDLSGEVERAMQAEADELLRAETEELRISTALSGEVVRAETEEARLNDVKINRAVAAETNSYILGDITVAPTGANEGNIHKIALNVDDDTFKEYDIPLKTIDGISLDIDLSGITVAGTVLSGALEDEIARAEAAEAAETLRAETVEAALSGRIEEVDQNVVHISGAETIEGLKTFSISPIVPSKDTDVELDPSKGTTAIATEAQISQAFRKAFPDNQVSGDISHAHTQEVVSVIKAKAYPKGPGTPDAGVTWDVVTHDIIGRVFAESDFSIVSDRLDITIESGKIDAGHPEGEELIHFEVPEISGWSQGVDDRKLPTSKLVKDTTDSIEARMVHKGSEGDISGTETIEGDKTFGTLAHKENKVTFVNEVTHKDKEHFEDVTDYNRHLVVPAKDSIITNLSALKTEYATEAQVYATEEQFRHEVVTIQNPQTITGEKTFTAPLHADLIVSQNGQAIIAKANPTLTEGTQYGDLIHITEVRGKSDLQVQPPNALDETHWQGDGTDRLRSVVDTEKEKKEYLARISDVHDVENRAIQKDAIQPNMLGQREVVTTLLVTNVVDKKATITEYVSDTDVLSGQGPVVRTYTTDLTAGENLNLSGHHNGAYLDGINFDIDEEIQEREDEDVRLDNAKIEKDAIQPNALGDREVVTTLLVTNVDPKKATITEYTSNTDMISGDAPVWNQYTTDLIAKENVNFSGVFNGAYIDGIAIDIDEEIQEREDEDARLAMEISGLEDRKINKSSIQPAFDGNRYVQTAFSVWEDDQSNPNVNPKDIHFKEWLSDIDEPNWAPSNSKELDFHLKTAENIKVAKHSNGIFIDEITLDIDEEIQERTDEDARLDLVKLDKDVFGGSKAYKTSIIQDLTVKKVDDYNATIDSIVRDVVAKDSNAYSVPVGSSDHTVKIDVTDRDPSVTAGEIDITVDQDELTNVVHRTYDETIDGVKTFLKTPILPNKGNIPTQSSHPENEAASEDQLFDVDQSAVHKTGNETIKDIKRFEGTIKADNIQKLEDNESIVGITNRIDIDTITFGNLVDEVIVTGTTLSGQVGPIDDIRNVSGHLTTKIDGITKYAAGLDEVELIKNKIKTLGVGSTDVEYPTAKATWTAIQAVRTEVMKYQFQLDYYALDIADVTTPATGDKIALPDGSVYEYDGSSWLPRAGYSIENGYTFSVRKILTDTTTKTPPSGTIIWSASEGGFDIVEDDFHDPDNTTLEMKVDGSIGVIEDSLDETYFTQDVDDALDLARRAFLREKVPTSGNGRQQLTTAIDMTPVSAEELTFVQHSVDVDGDPLAESTPLTLKGGLEFYDNLSGGIGVSSDNLILKDSIQPSFDGNRYVQTAMAVMDVQPKDILMKEWLSDIDNPNWTPSTGTELSFHIKTGDNLNASGHTNGVYIDEVTLDIDEEISAREDGDEALDDAKINRADIQVQQGNGPNAGHREVLTGINVTEATADKLVIKTWGNDVDDGTALDDTLTIALGAGIEAGFTASGLQLSIDGPMAYIDAVSGDLSAEVYRAETEEERLADEISGLEDRKIDRAVAAITSDYILGDLTIMPTATANIGNIHKIAENVADNTYVEYDFGLTAEGGLDLTIDASGVLLTAERLSGAISGLVDEAALIRSDVSGQISAEVSGLNDRIDLEVSGLSGRIEEVDSGAVHLSGAETIGGVKTFTSDVKFQSDLVLETGSRFRLLGGLIIDIDGNPILDSSQTDKTILGNFAETLYLKTGFDSSGDVQRIKVYKDKNNPNIVDELVYVSESNANMDKIISGIKYNLSLLKAQLDYVQGTGGWSGNAYDVPLDLTMFD